MGYDGRSRMNDAMRTFPAPGDAVQPGDGRQRLEAWNLRPIRVPKARDEVVAVLVDAIRVGRWGIGDQLPSERDLTEQLQVSRIVVRGAIEVLRREGIVQTRRGRGGGTVLVSVDNLPRVLAGLRGEYTSNIRTRLEFRRIIETAATQRTAALATDSELAELRALVDLLGASLDLSHAEILQIDTQFHIMVGELSRNALLAAALSETLKDILVLRSFFPHGHVEVRQSFLNQQRLMAAIETRDPDRVRQAVDDHLAAFEETSLGFRLDPPR